MPWRIQCSRAMQNDVTFPLKGQLPDPNDFDLIISKTAGGRDSITTQRIWHLECQMVTCPMTSRDHTGALGHWRPGGGCAVRTFLPRDATQSVVLPRQVVCPLTSSLSADPYMTDLLQREHSEILAGIGVGYGKLSIFAI